MDPYGFSEYLGHAWLVVCCPSTMLPAMACHPYGQDMEHHPAGNQLMPDRLSVLGGLTFDGKAF